MNNYEELHKSICRICLNYGNTNNMVSLINNNSGDGLSCHGKAVLKFANISIKKGDNYPPAMCVKCLNLLKQAIHFKLLCESSDKCLKNLTANYGSPKERIVDYTMLRYYFPEEFSKQNKRKREPCTSPAGERKSLYKCGIQDPINTKCNEVSTDDDYLGSEPVKLDEHDRLLNEMERLMYSHVNKFENIKEPIKKKPKLKSKKHSTLVTKKIKFKRVKKEKKSVVCNICNKVLASQATYKYHMERHNGCSYICEHCGKGFPIGALLQYHKVQHHNVGSYIQCSQCPFKTPHEFELIEHERLHTGERPFACEHCGLTFRRRAIWKKHLIHHSEKKIQCPQCPKKFYLKSEMLSHANNIHNRVYMYSCNECGATYAQSQTVRKHLTERHGIPRKLQGRITRVNKDTSDKNLME